MFNFFKSEEQKIIDTINDICSDLKDDERVKNVAQYFYMILTNYKKSFDEKKFRQVEFMDLKEHWLALNFQLILGCIAKRGNFKIYNKVREVFKIDSNLKVAKLINKNYAPLYANIRSDLDYAILAEELLFSCFQIPKEIDAKSVNNEYYEELSDFILKQNTPLVKTFN